jgi:hypothetical protein
VYWSGPAVDPRVDFDLDCVGYPVGARTPIGWKNGPEAEAHRYDTTRPGLSNAGHYEKILTREDGTEKLAPDEKRDLLHFLKTL